MSRIKQMREMKTKSYMNKKDNYIQRESGWDERFYLSRLKDYSNLDKSNNTKTPRKYNLESNLNYIKSQIKTVRKDTKSSYSKYRPSKSGNHYGNMTSNNYYSNYNYDDDLQILNNKNNNDEFSFIKNMNNEEIDTYINFLWDDLGVLNEYRNNFYNISNSIENNDSKNDFFCLEIENLKNLENYLIKFKKENENREKCINQLKKLNSAIEKQFINFKIDIADNMMIDFTKNIQNLRNFTINVVLLVNNIREISSYGKMNNKFNFDNLKKYNYTNDYLIKIRNDLDFLGKSLINNYKGMKLHFNSKEDPFLISINNFIPISPENLKKIRQCQYIIMQDVIFNNSNDNNSKNYNDIKKNNRYNNDNNSENKSNKNKKIIIDYNDRNNEKKENENDYKLDDNIIKLKKKLEPIKKEDKKGIENIGLNDIKKQEEFNKFLQKRKNDYNDYLNKDNYDFDNDDDEIEDEIENKKKEIAQIKKEDEKRKLKIKKSNSNEINELRELQKEKKEEEKRKKEIEELRKKEADEIIKKKTKDSIKKIKEEEEKKIKEEEEKKIKEEEEKKIKEEEDKKIKEEKEKKIKEEKEKKIKEEEEKKIKEEKEKKIKEEEEKDSFLIKESIEEDGGNELKKSILNNSRLNRYSRISNNSLRRSMTPETYKKTALDNFNFSFFTGEIKDFITAYNNYYKNIPENQKIIFNLNSNIFEKITKFFTPKIIICSDKKSSLLIKGICIIGFLFEKNNIKIYLIHLSSSDENERDNIITYFITFIKKHIECDEIIVDLYYKYDEDIKKFTIDTEIRDLFKVILKFKWVKLENLSNHIRYQKMNLRIDKNEMLESVGNNNITIIKLTPHKLFEINDNCNISIKEISDDDINENDNNNNDKYINLFSVVSIYSQMKSIENYQFSNYNDKFKNFFEEKKFEDLNLSNYIQLKMNDINVDSSSNNFNSDLIHHSLNINLFPIFNSTISIQYNDYLYNRIESNEIKILIDKNTQMKFYLIPTLDEYNSILISEVNEEKKNTFINNNTNIYDLFRDFYDNISNDNNSENNNNSNIVIYIPSFKIDTKYSCNEINCLKDIKINKNDKNYKLNNIEEKIKIEYKSDPHKECGFNISINEKTENIIKDNFIISIVNSNVLSSLSFPSILLLYITKENWIKKK